MINQKGFVAPLILIIVAIIVALVLIYTFLAKPYKVYGDNVVSPFKQGQLLFSEKVTYLFRKPAIGDRVIFRPLTPDQDYSGIITKEEDNNGILIFTVSSNTSGKPWTVSVDKIIRKIYYPAVNKDEVTRVVQYLNITPTPTPAPITYETNNWKTYTNKQYGFSFKYPTDWVVKTGTRSAWDLKVGTYYGFARFYNLQDKIEVPSMMNKGNQQMTLNMLKEDFDNIKEQAVLPETIIANKRVLFLSTGAYILINPKSNLILQIFRYPDEENYVNNILSTFKFSDTSVVSEKYTCPENGFQNCMPILDAEGQKQCTKEALDWKQANCPNFSGAAY